MTSDYIAWNFFIVMGMMAIGGVVVIIKYENLRSAQDNITKDILKMQDKIDDLKQKNTNLNAKMDFAVKGIEHYVLSTSKNQGFGQLDSNLESFIKWTEIDEAEFD